jgi:DNA-binding XRE family transcriptional regulator
VIAIAWPRQQERFPAAGKGPANARIMVLAGSGSQAGRTLLGASAGGGRMPSELARMIDLRIAHRIRQRRLRIGMTQQKLAQIIGVVFQQAHKYEHGLSRVSASRLFHIATALQAPITYFFAIDDGASAPGRGRQTVSLWWRQ